jgi:hypothetical protein
VTNGIGSLPNLPGALLLAYLCLNDCPLHLNSSSPFPNWKASQELTSRETQRQDGSDEWQVPSSSSVYPVKSSIGSLWKPILSIWPHCLVHVGPFTPSSPGTGLYSMNSIWKIWMSLQEWYLWCWTHAVLDGRLKGMVIEKNTEIGRSILVRWGE